MATKLKSISKNKFARLIAFVLAFVMFAVSGCFSSIFIKSEFVYNTFDGRPYIQTAAFRSILNSLELTAIFDGENIVVESLEEYKKTSNALAMKRDYDHMKQTAESSFNLLDKSGIGVYVTQDNLYRYRLTHNGETYYFSYDGTLVSAEEFNSYTYVKSNEGTTNANGESVTEPESAPQFTPENELDSVGDAYINKISSALHFIFYTSYNGYNINYGEVSKEAFLVSLDNSYLAELERRYNNEKTSAAGYYTLSRLNSIRYAVKFKNMENVLTNSGVVSTDNRQLIVQKLGGELVESFANGKYVSETKAPKRSESILAQLYYSLSDGALDLTSAMNYMSMDDVEWAYFSYNPAMGDGDLAIISEGLYNTHTAKAIKSLGFSLSAALILFVLASAVCIWLIASAGKTEDDEVRLCFYDKVPFEINLLLGLGAMVLCVLGLYVLVFYELYPSSMVYADDFIIRLAGVIGAASTPTTALIVAIFFATPTIMTMSVARNVKTKSFRKHTLCRYIFMPAVWLFKKISGFFRKLKNIFKSDYSDKKLKNLEIAAVVTIILFFAIVTLLVFLGYAFGDEIGAVMIILAVLMMISAIFYCIILIDSFDRIMRAVSDIRHGVTDVKINTDHMPVFLKKFADDITSIGDGLKEAVYSAVKDQKMKAELITNVSHDLKTPLTSIVSYVDLLKRCNVEGEDANKYISILDEKAHRMKKLIEDLVEASKASSGAMEVHPVKVNLCEFAAQAVGEHEDELKAVGTEIVLTLPQGTVNAMADPMKISRVVENLFSNIRKYAMKGTRVYADISENDEYAVLTIKNISRNPLNVPAEELMQRFVRGDSSRSGEGSGLGLSIVKNLCELQGGRFSINVDGDLFKAVVELPKA
ncbi:MAG: HAMP domain-containing histidine kinase [Clostridia bacterium]|nr:HAMP domain-containing histidine kinase [Clostridia bacterium]